MFVTRVKKRQAKGRVYLSRQHYTLTVLIHNYFHIQTQWSASHFLHLYRSSTFQNSLKKHDTAAKIEMYVKVISLYA